MRNPYAPPSAELEGVSVPVVCDDGELRYVGFWRRFGAFWIDALILLPIAAIPYLLSGQVRLFYLYSAVPSVLINYGFSVYLVFRYGGTPGKLLLHTRVAMVDGSPVTFSAANVRYAVSFVLSVLAVVAVLMASLKLTDQQYFSGNYIARSTLLAASTPKWYQTVVVLSQVWVWSEFVTMMFNRKRRAVQDFMAGTIVVKTSARA